ncbi:MAG: hypothetical protein IH960_05150, partial [Chloroflexi bacterium]|nr:hypothetical protein [Chloroflexota bacterium]
MTAVNKLQKFFIGGLAALVLTTAIACSGGTDAVDPTASTVPTTEQVSNAGDDSPVLLAGTVTLGEAGSANAVSGSSVDSGNSVGEGGSIQTAFEEGDSDKSTGDALPEIVVEESPELAPGVPPEVWINVLTPAEIVAAQGEHLADLYERTVQSVVFIRAVTAQGEGSGSGFVWDTDGHIVTNYHVVQGANSLTVKFFNGRE